MSLWKTHWGPATDRRHPETRHFQETKLQTPASIPTPTRPEAAFVSSMRASPGSAAWPRPPSAAPPRRARSRCQPPPPTHAASARWWPCSAGGRTRSHAACGSRGSESEFPSRCSCSSSSSLGASSAGSPCWRWSATEKSLDAEQVTPDTSSSSYWHTFVFLPVGKSWGHSEVKQDQTSGLLQQNKHTIYTHNKRMFSNIWINLIYLYIISCAQNQLWTKPETYIPYMWPRSIKAVISSTGIFVAIANNTLYRSKLYIFILCQKS